MILLENKLISEDIIDKTFVCDLNKCQGACCVKGDAGAPLLQNEIDIISSNLSTISENIDPAGADAIMKSGFYIGEGEATETHCLPTGACVFVKHENGVATCGIEKTYEQGKINFKKPISCHLYPIRVSKVGEYTALNYHQWDICKEACNKGQVTGTPIYIFLKDAITRAFGKDFFNQLEAYAIQRQ